MVVQEKASHVYGRTLLTKIVRPEAEHHQMRLQKVRERRMNDELGEEDGKNSQ